MFNVIKDKSCDSVVGIATDYGLDDRGTGVRDPVESMIFSSPSRLGPTQSPIQWVPEVLSPRREADHSSPTSAHVKKMWIYTSSPPYAFMAQCLIS
jgi:hypothetical protein